MKKKEKDYSRYHIEECICELSKDEKSHWGKYLLKCSFDDGQPTIDIRRMKYNPEDSEDYIIGKGISISNEETDKLTNALIEKGFGDVYVMEKEIKRRKSLYGLDDEE